VDRQHPGSAGCKHVVVHPVADLGVRTTGSDDGTQRCASSVMSWILLRWWS
jgi:hypothetical protein